MKDLLPYVLDLISNPNGLVYSEERDCNQLYRECVEKFDPGKYFRMDLQYEATLRYEKARAAYLELKDLGDDEFSAILAEAQKKFRVERPDDKKNSKVMILT